MQQPHEYRLVTWLLDLLVSALGHTVFVLTYLLSSALCLILFAIFSMIEVVVIFGGQLFNRLLPHKPQ